MERLDRILSQAGAATRSEAKTLIKAGRVTVDGVTASRPEQKVGEDSVVALDGRALGRGRIYLLLYKPAGVVSSTRDPRDRTVLELLPEVWRGKDLFPVGRLDKDTEGLLLLTDDGDLAHRLTSPRYAVEKTYYARVDGVVDETDAAAFAQGMTLADGTLCRPAVLEPLEPGACRVKLREGKYHQVRRMLAARGKPVTYLRREAEGGLDLRGLEPGQVRELTEGEVAALRREAEKS